MVQFNGKYVHEKNENLDEYFKTVGVPYIPRKVMTMSKPTLEIKNENDEWTIISSTLIRNSCVKFKLNEEYEESMPGGIMKCTASLEDDKLIIHSIGPNETTFTRTYEFSEEGCIMIMKHEASGIEAKRYFKRVVE